MFLQFRQGINDNSAVFALLLRFRDFLIDVLEAVQDVRRRRNHLEEANLPNGKKKEAMSERDSETHILHYNAQKRRENKTDDVIKFMVS